MRLKNQIYVDNASGVKALAVLGDLIFAGCGSGRIAVIRSNKNSADEKYETVSTTHAHDGAVTSLSLANSHLASGGADCSVKIFSVNAESGELKQVADLKGAAGQVTTVCLSPDGKVAFAGTASGSQHLWATAAADSGPIWSSGASDDEQGAVRGANFLTSTRVTFGIGNFVWRLDCNDKTVSKLCGAESAVMNTAMSPDNSLLVTYDSRGTVQLVDASSGSALYSVNDGKLEASAGSSSSSGFFVAFNPIAYQLLIAHGPVVKKLNLESKKFCQDWHLDSRAATESMTVSGDGQSLLVGFSDDTVRYFDISIDDDEGNNNDEGEAEE